MTPSATINQPIPSRLGCRFVWFVLLVWTASCAPTDPNAPEPLKPESVFGVAGQSLGQFGYPRAIDVDPRRGVVYVVDKTARVQRFGFDGVPQLQWRMPEMANGKPTGISVAPDGRVFVADTHYFRVMVYDSDGRELMQFGRYGTGHGEFIYPTDIAFGPEGRLYVSEYGGNDRIQVFDQQGGYLFEFGGFGSKPGQFNRPQSLAFSESKTELFIADACNHRIVVVDPQGNFLRSFGSAGNGAGQLAYPYGVTICPDQSLMVAEFGNNRIQQFDQSGASIGVFGHVGRGRGELQYPWGLAVMKDQLFILDSGNNRVQVVPAP
ncbi:MAG: SMP-30/gluconolactonase/LRE family protein [Phycisphaerales bacterium]|nr:SMP-30/gluconolactonase/LRE family protein [Phycisphaerales bacterium]